MGDPRHLDEQGDINIASDSYVIKDGKVLMFKRSETASKFPGYWIGPGGHINKDEDALLAAMREVEEEAGVKVSPDDIKLKAIAIHTHLDLEEVWMSFIFLTTINEDQKTIDAHREGNAEWIELEKLLQMENVFPPAKYYFDHVLNDKQGILYTNILWEDSQLVKVQSERVDKNG